MFVQRDELAKGLWSQSIGKDGVRWAVAFEGAVWHLECLDSVCGNFRGSFAERERFGLSKEVGHQEIMMTPQWVQSWSMKSHNSLVPL